MSVIALKRLCSILIDKGADQTLSINRFLAQKEKGLSPNDRKYLLQELAELLLYEEFTIPVAECFGPVLFEILSHFTYPDEDWCSTTVVRECFTVALGKLIWLFPDAAKFAKSYFSKAPSIWARFDDQEQDHVSKRRKKNPEAKVTIRHLLQAALQFLTFDFKYYHNLWNWNVLVRLTQHKNTNVRWLAYRCLSLVGSVRQADLRSMVRFDFGEDGIRNLEKRDASLLSHTEEYDLFKLCLPTLLKEEDWLQHQGLEGFKEHDFSPNVVTVSGILLEKISSDSEVTNVDEFVLVPSMEQYLHSLALAVASGNAILIQGPVGCGKTTIVEHLAFMTGRIPQRDLLKIQLGDRMDSKLLLGSHHCTEAPGEFMWQPGLLTEAMIHGHWLLLEDIDCAPMDVISLLVPVLQSSSIILPGHANPIKAASGFQLFATQRLVTGHEGSFAEFKSNAEILDKLWRKVTIFPMPKQELQQVISKRWKVLEPVIDKILSVHYMIVSGEDGEGAMDSVPPQSFYGGRLVSTRDLFKWCTRISKDFILNSPDTVITTFQEALDCYCQSIPNMNNRVALAEAVGVKFNLPAVKAENFCKRYKPNISFSSNSKAAKIGRAVLSRKESELISFQKPFSSVFAHTQQSVALLEKVAVAVQNQEPVLLVGETGTGKTSVVQYLAHITRNDLVVVNMNQQSDSIDLLGGYKPVDQRLLVLPVKLEYEEIFCATFSKTKNLKFMNHIMHCFQTRRWKALFTLMSHTLSSAINRLNEKSNCGETKALIKRWKKLGTRIRQLQVQILQQESSLAFAFIEGTLVKAMRDGKWLLLDEINLAEAETLECLCGVLEKHDNSLFLLEKGDKEPVVRHPDFRLFACMNPATNVGKKDLAAGIRNRFTEFFVEELEERSDLITLVDAYLHGLTLSGPVLENIVDFYLYSRKMAAQKLSDGTGHHPHYSLRTLCRALNYAASNPCGCVPRSLFEAFSLSFLSQLDHSSHPIMKNTIIQYILGKKNQPSVLKKMIPEPTSGKYINIEGYWIPCGSMEPQRFENYVLTASVKRNLQDLSRIVSAGKYPVLLQGETSVGKTSLVQWLAHATGNYCVRVNNHEHTDIQEYIGSYSVDENGRLVFKEGILVDAMRNGYWIILDELNLAPTEVMEALNRVLDDNRELFITETQLIVKASPKFLIFATQNPAGLFGGRKVLSRAFRNRFVELHFDHIPPVELESILEQRCALPLSYCKKLVAVMQELQLRRRESGIFAGKHGFITLRDLFRWGERYRLAFQQTTKFYDWNQHLGEEGYMLLAGKVRRPEEVEVIKEVIEKHVKCKIDPHKLFTFGDGCASSTMSLMEDILNKPLPDMFQHLVWTFNLRRLAVLVAKALKFNEPVLLIGTTGCGKTTVCQLLAELSGRQLDSINCHMHTESADFLGGLRPVRNQHGEEEPSKLFEWVEGSLVTAMRNGNFFLIDEISLADDSVLERLNSVLEPERTILLTEKFVDSEDACVTAHPTFRIMATMNPGGDFGKKELSPAMRNRFTEIWCPSDIQHGDLVSIIDHNVHISLSSHEMGSGFGQAMTEFLYWFLSTEYGRRFTVSMRDILAWVEFINKTAGDAAHTLPPAEAYIHGACLVYLDSLGSGPFATRNKVLIHGFVNKCVLYLAKQITDITEESVDLSRTGLSHSKEEINIIKVQYHPQYFSIGAFAIPCGPNVITDISEKYDFEAPTPKLNLLRIMRALQVEKPILIEGSPGVGKTSLVSSIAQASGHEVVRINLSEQTDVTDLFGADLPVEGGGSGEFAWRDGTLLQALKNGQWVLLDELNLASQSVLEGLNACLDHRGEIYIPELGMTFKVQTRTTRIFGCQNPYREGGARKGLPQSFVNRFTQVYVEPLTDADLEFIAGSMYPKIPRGVIAKMVAFNEKVVKEVCEDRLWGHKGSPWEFNLRDIFRWCEAIVKNQDCEDCNPGEFLELIYSERLRTSSDRREVSEIYRSVFGSRCPIPTRYLQMNVFSTCIQLGYSVLPRRGSSDLLGQRIFPLHFQLSAMESLMKCLEMNWMAILVGPSGSGKTTIVQYVAALTGHPVHIFPVNSDTDTTELLGGFEQADLNRHVDYLAQNVEQLVNQTLLECLNKKDGEELLKLEEILSNLADYKKMHQSTENLATVEEVQAFQEKLNLLKKILVDIQAVQNSEEFASVLYECYEMYEELDSKLKGSGSVSSGGKFEWVDSVLVRAIKKGHWILIDDVNFCSPSVLDRLNGLIEPNGVLTITEQGAVEDEILTIRPHPDFRIILAMDPKNGEISRPMRNRGVEIFILFEGLCLKKESEGPDMWDTVTLLHARGLPQSQLMDALVKIHQDLDITKTGNPTLCDLLAVASLTVQNLQKHGDPMKALWNSCHSVYIRSILNNAERKNAEVMVRDILCRVSVIRTDLKSCFVPALNLFSSSLDYEICSSAATIKQSAALFTYMVHQLSSFVIDEPNFGAYQPFANDLIPCPLQVIHHPSLTDEWLRLVVCISRIVMESGSRDNWRPLCSWMYETFINSVVDEGEGGYMNNLVNLCTTFLSNHLHSAVEFPVAHELLDTLRTCMEGITYCEISEEELPLDLRWNQCMFNKLKEDMKMCDDRQNVEALIEHLVSCANRFHLLLMMISFQYTEIDVPSQQGQSQNSSLFGLSKAVSENRLGVENLPHPFISCIFPFFENFYHVVTELLKQKSYPCSNETYWKIREALYLYYGIVRFCNEPCDVVDLENQISLFTVHWSVVMKKVLNVLNQLEGSSSMFSEIITQADTISQELGLKVSEDLKLRSKLSKFLGCPSAFVNEEAAKLHGNVTNIAPNISIPSVIKSSSKMYEHMKLIISQDGALTQKLSEAFYQSLDSKSGHERLLSANNSVHLVELQLNEAELLLIGGGGSDDDDEDVMEVCDLPLSVTPISPSQMAVNFQMLPLWDYLFVLVESWVLADAASLVCKNFLQQKQKALHLMDPKMCQLDFLIETGSDKLCIDPAHIGMLLSINSHNLKNLLAEFVVCFFNHARNGASSDILNKCLLVNEETVMQKNSGTDMIQSMDGVWKNKVTWAGNAPVLAYICQKILQGLGSYEKFEDSLSLGTCVEKSKQIEMVKRLLWKYSEHIVYRSKGFRDNATTVVTCWFENLVTGLSSLVSLPLPQLGTHEHDLKILSHKLGLSAKMMLQSDTDILVAIARDIELLKSLVEDKSNYHKVQWQLGKCLALVGILTIFLLAPVDPIDPAKKCEAKNYFFKCEFREVKREIGLRNWQVMSTTGQNSMYYKHLHPHVSDLVLRESYLCTKLEKLRKKCAYRPPTSQFLHLRTMVQNYLQSVGSPAANYEIITKMENFKMLLETQRAGDKEFSEVVRFVNEVATWSESQKAVIHELKSKFFLYRDMVLPFVAGIEQMLMGAQMMSQHLSVMEVHLHAPLLKSPTIEAFLTSMCSFPTITADGNFQDPKQIADFLSNEETMSTVKYLCSFHEPDLIDHKIIFNLTKSQILEIMNAVAIFPQKDAEGLLSLAHSAIKVFHEAWIKVEEESEMKKRQDESLYEYKVHTHEADLSDEEVLLQDLSVMFPSYKEDFSEFLSTTEDEKKTEVPQRDEKSTAEVKLSLSAEDMLETWSLHSSVVFGLVDSSNFNAASEFSHIVIKRLTSPDLATPFLLRYEILKEVINTIGEKLDNALDRNLIGAHLFACTAAKQMMDTSHDNQFSSSSKYYDIYHDPNPSEVLQCRPLLENIIYRVNSLLVQFPDNLLLKDVLKITMLILSFPVASPLIKFVTGMELLLATAQAWEQNAHSGVSLKQELSEISDKIIYCRKLELSCWRQCLDSVMRKQYVDSAKWWFHMFSVLTDFFDHSIVESPDFAKEWNENQRDIVIKSLQQLMKGSTIGEFCARLDILHTFLLDFELRKQVRIQREIAAVLFNMYKYYHQFLPAITKKISDVRSPIEKEVKDFIKISQWNDINFWSMKQSVEKSHQTIHKHMKLFEKELNQPALPFFHVPSKKDVADIENIPWSMDINVASFLEEVDYKDIPQDICAKTDTSHELGSKLMKPGKLYHKVRKNCQKAVEKCPLAENINALNEFAGDVIENILAMEALNVNKDAEKEKQESEAHQIHHRKCQALASLFKSLNQLGLSYRQGLLHSRKFEVNDALCVNSLDAKYIKLDQEGSLAGSDIVRCMDDTNHYYYKCVAQFAFFKKLLENPSKELDMSIIEKCEGFTGCLMHIAVSQRSKFARDLKDIVDLKTKAKSFLNMCANKDDFTERALIPPQEYVLDQQAKVFHILLKTVASLEQFLALMECCPLTSEEHFPCIDEPNLQSPVSLASKRDSLWNNTVHEVRKILDITKSVISVVSPDNLKTPFLFWEDLKIVSECFSSLGKLSADILNLKDSLECNDEPVYLTECLQSAYGAIQKGAAECLKVESVLKNATCHEMNSVDALEFSTDEVKRESATFKTCLQLLLEILIAIEGTHRLNEQINKHSDVKDSRDKLISDKTGELLSKMSGDILRIKKIKKHVNFLVKSCKIGSSKPSDVAETYINNACAVAPILFQYCQLLEFYMVSALGMHRTTCKMLSVLLGLFTTLAEKGFCLPQGIEIKKGDTTEFHDIPEGGLGDGEGTKNVSKDIETEDQLEDAMKEGEEKKEEKSESPDVKKEEDGIEMSEDFAGKLHDVNPEAFESDEEDYDSETELDKKMGEISPDLSENINEKLWGSDSEDEDEELQHDDAGDGVTQDGPKVLTQKDQKEEDKDEEESPKDRKKPDSDDAKGEDEYDGEHPNPNIGKPSSQEPEIIELPEDIQLDKDECDNEGQSVEEMPVEEVGDTKHEETETVETEDHEVPMEQDDENEQMKGEKVPDPNCEKEDEVTEEQSDEKKATEMQHSGEGSFEGTVESSLDNVQDSEQVMEWEYDGSQENAEQQKEGQAASSKALSQVMSREGENLSLLCTVSEVRGNTQQDQKPPDEGRSVGSALDGPVEKMQVTEKKNAVEQSETPERESKGAHWYEHVEDSQKGDAQALDTATEEQASGQTCPPQQEYDDDDDDVIALDDEDDDDTNMQTATKVTGEVLDSKRDKSQNFENAGNENDESKGEIPGVVAPTLRAARKPNTTIHTQHDLWSAMSTPGVEKTRKELEQTLNLWCQSIRGGAIVDSRAAQRLWHKYEDVVGPLVQELCEQLRLVLEPTKMTKMKGDYRTGKRLNMRKIVPYIASQFRKDKIWLRRTKPTKRQYQIMLAVDDSQSMSFNESRQLAFESLALIGKSLSLLEAGDLAIVSFGENVKVLHSFSEKFTDDTGAKILQELSFDQQDTRVVQLVEYAISSLLKARNGVRSQLMSKETAQLLLIVSDGRGVDNEGGDNIRSAIRKARDNNIYIVFVIVDNPEQESILDTQKPVFDSQGKVVKLQSYMETFPFPFYILLREISSLPLVLGEALRQWFELVTSVER